MKKNPDFSVANMALQSPGSNDVLPHESSDLKELEDDITQIAYQGDEVTGPDVSASLSCHIISSVI